MNALSKGQGLRGNVDGMKPTHAQDPAGKADGRDVDVALAIENGALKLRLIGGDICDDRGDLGGGGVEPRTTDCTADGGRCR